MEMMKFGELANNTKFRYLDALGDPHQATKQANGDILNAWRPSSFTDDGKEWLVFPGYYRVEEIEDDS